MLIGDVGFIKDNVAVYIVHEKNEKFSTGVEIVLDDIEDIVDIYHFAERAGFFKQRELIKWKMRQIKIIFM